MSHYLAFDLGASSGRAILGTLENGKLSFQELHRFINAPTEIDGSIYWDFPRLCEELKTGLKKAVAVAGDIRSIGVDTWGVDYVLFDKDTRKMRRLPYHYRDHRTDDPAPVWAKCSKEELYAATGIQHMTLNTVFQLCAHQKAHPEDFENSVFLPIPDALAFALGGDFTGEYTHASTTELLDPRTCQWNWSVIDKLGLPRSIFPALVMPGTKGGQVSAELCKELGCGPIPIIKVASHDTGSAVAAVPAPASGEWAYICTGTWALLGAELKAPFITAESCQESFTNEGGWNRSIRFLTNIMGSWLFQETRRNWNEAGRNLSFGDLEQMALTAEPFRFFIDPNDRSFAAPCDMPEKIREFCRATGQGTPDDAELVRAIYDSLAFYFKTKVAKLEKLLGIRYQALNIVGGGTQAKLLMQQTCDAIGIPVIAGPIEATAAGNIIVQAIASGEIADLAAGRQVVRDSFEVIRYQPDAANSRRFAELLPRFQALTGR